ncbi:MAG: ACP phosphodiesterase [Vibrio sp.]
MNFLAHLHIATHCQSSLMGNLLGDFVKGNPNQKYPKNIVDGIYLHRFVDRYTDTHPLVLEQKGVFPSQLRRFSPIALDMFWDHCLAKHWDQFYPDSLRGFLEQCQKEWHSVNYFVPEKFTHTSQLMWKNQWLLSYQDIDNIVFALQRMSLRRERFSPLAECGQVLIKHYDDLKRIFFRLYPEVLEQAKIFSQDQLVMKD